MLEQWLKLPSLIRISPAGTTGVPSQLTRPDSRFSDDLDEEEDRLVINEDEDKRDHLNLKENVLNLKSDKPRKKHLRFNGMPEEEVAKKQLPDLIHDHLDILIVSPQNSLTFQSNTSCSTAQVGINPGLYAAFKGHHYAGPGNHFCKQISNLFKNFKY